MFPTLPALFLALAISRTLPAGAAAGADRHADRHDPRRRPASCSRSGRAITARSACPTCCGPARASTPAGAASAWQKAWMMLSGIGNYFLPSCRRLGRSAVGQARAWRLALSVAAAGGDPGRLRRHAVAAPQRAARAGRSPSVFLGTLAAGQVMNFYSQPQDPQMQINVMAWLAVAWGLLLTAMAATARLRGRSPCCRSRRWSSTPRSFARWRGGDTARRGGGRDASSSAFRPNSTVFVYWGFEPITMWQFALWSRTWDWDGTARTTRSSNGSRSMPAPSAIPHWTPEQHAAVDPPRHRGGVRQAAIAW